MKRILAIVLAVLLALTLFACSNDNAGTASEQPSGEPSEAAAVTSVEPTKAADSSGQTNTGDYGEDELDNLGFYDPEFDYAAGENYTITYMILYTSPLYDTFDSAFAHWASLMNMTYEPMWAANSDNDLFLNQLQTFIDQGVDGFLMDPDPNIFNRIDEICAEAGVPYIGCMSPSRDMESEGTPMLGPYVGFDFYWFGQQMGQELISYAETNWPDVPMEEIGFIAVDYSLYDALHQRSLGAQDVWLEQTGLEDNFFFADTATLGMTVDAANTLVTGVISSEPQFNYWLCATLYDDLAQGAASAFDSMGLTDNACVTAIGGAALQAQWDAGQEDAWRFTVYTSPTIYAEPIIGALYAFMSGQATPETIWPSWVNPEDHGSEGDTYATLLLPSYIMTHDNYQQLLEWSDVYCGADEYSYDDTGIERDTYNARMDIPDSYKAG